MSDLSGLKVLIVEDEGLVALMIEDMLQDLGCQIVASVSQLSDAKAIADTIEVDMAVLDINLAGQPSFPVAEILRERQIPFVFSTGYGASGLPTEFAGNQVLGKPFSAEELEQKVTLTLASGRVGHRAGTI
ncbi:response regulator [Phyllobacterium salinisoli]|uniref:Response regulator n=1 Tax=Phyllobacterium salinisoli TaxID=1899321 RepID=A0A368K7K3_9HYPH|nr:response regulator [Phyllobacterium salinisoli]RCS25336.1 response regulator [Phyllobacterium salinisoli]